MLKQKRRITMYVSLVVAVLILSGPLASEGRGDFTLWNDEQLTVNTVLPDSTGTLFDRGHVRIVSGGYVQTIYAYDQSTVTTSGGTVSNVLAYSTSTVDVSSGEIPSLRARGASSVSISGGWVDRVYAYDTVKLDISGGLMDYVAANDTTGLNISGGSMDDVFAYGTTDMSDGAVEDFYAYGTANMSGGSVIRFDSRSGSVVEISGGSIINFAAHNNSTTTFDVRDFRLGEGLTLDADRLLGEGRLSCEWFDGTRWTTNIVSNPSGATILIIPEPTTLILLATGALAVLRRRRR